MDKKLDVYVIKPTPALKGWKRKMGVLGWHGDDLYISAVIAGFSADDAALCSIYDGVPCAYAEKTVLVPESWARKENPERAPLFDKVRERAIAVRNERGSSPVVTKVECTCGQPSPACPNAVFSDSALPNVQADS